MKRRSTLKTLPGPAYSSLSNVVFHHRAEGLVTNTTNSYGVVDGSDNVTKIISVLTTVHEFDSNGTAPTLTGTGVEKAIVFGGAGRLRHNGASSVFNAFHFVAGAITDLKWSIHGVIKMGASANPNAIYGLCGNYAGASSNKGVGIHYDDRAASTLSQIFNLSVTRGVSSSFILQCNTGNIFPPNQWVDFWADVDMSRATNQKGRIFFNGRQFSLPIRIDSTTMVTTPSFAMEIGGLGNATTPAVMEVKEITFQSGVQTDSFIQEFIINRMTKYRIVPDPHSQNNIIFRTEFLPIIEGYFDNRYYLPVSLAQNPTSPDIIVALLKDSISHVFDPDGMISIRRSTDRGKTWGAKSTAFIRTNPEAPMSVGVGYSSDGATLHAIIDTHTTDTGASVQKLYHLTSTDDGDNWTVNDISSVIPSDLLLGFRVDQSIIENAGVLMLGWYKTTDESSAAESANYLLRSTDNGANWSNITVRAKSATHRNEGSTVALSSTVLLHVIRDEVTVEWHQYISTDNGLNWASQGALTLGEALTRECPVYLRTFLLNGSLVVAVYYSDRDNDIFKVVYGLASGFSAGGVANWNVSSKFVIAQGNAQQHYHYGSVIHTHNDMNAIAMYPYDMFPSGGLGVENIVHTFNIQTSQYAFVKDLLGI